MTRLLRAALTWSCIPVVSMIVGPSLMSAAQSPAAPQTITAARRAGPPRGPLPRFPNGMVMLTETTWMGGGSRADIEAEGGLKKGELDALMQPWAKKLMESRNETQDPHNFCMPDVVPRATPFPFRFVQNFTHAVPTHMFILQEGNIHSYRQIFMDGRRHPDDFAPRGTDIQSGTSKRTRWSSIRSASMTRRGSTMPAARTPSNCTPSSDGRASTRDASRTS